MTELTAFLASIYDAFSEAEMQALQHGQMRLSELLESGTVPEDVTVPVYHASDVQVNLDVGLVAEETKDGMEVIVTDPDHEEASELNFGVELFELLEKEDLEDLKYDQLLPGSAGGLSTGTPGKEREKERQREEEAKEEEGKREDERQREEEAKEEEEKREEERQREEEAKEEEEKREDERQREEEAGEEEEKREDERQREEEERDTNDPPIDVIDDIDHRYRVRLRDAGIERLSHLVERSSEEVAEALAEEDTEVSPEQAAEWVSEARGLSSLLSEREADLPVELVDGIGPTFGSRLRDAGLGDLSDLAALSPEEVAEHASSDEVTVSAERAVEWLDRAASHLEAVRSGETPEVDSEVDRIDLAPGTEESGATDAEEANE